MVAATFALVFIACKKKEITPAVVDSDTLGATENALSEGTFNDVSNISDQGAAGGLSSYLSTDNGSGERGILSTCAIVSSISPNIPHTFTIDFGTSGTCTCSDNRIRKGIITVSYSGSVYATPGDTITITFNNYSVNGNMVSNSSYHKIIYNGLNNSQHPNYTIDVNASITKAGGGVITWISHRTREWTDGYTTTTGAGHCADDAFTVSGYAHGTHSNGNSFDETATNLRLHSNWPYIESGLLNITPSGKAARLIDFGTDGTCDAKATVTISGHVYNITL